LVIVAPLLWICFLFTWIRHVLSGGYKRPKVPRSIVITGASSGIGADLAKHYAQNGVALALIGRNQERLQETVKACEAKGAKVSFLKADVTEQDSLQDFLLKFDAESPVDLIIANAGVTEGTSATSNDIVAATRTLFGTNVYGTFNTILPLIPKMKERQSGQIALMASITAYTGAPRLTSYAATKAALKIYGEGLRGMLYRDNIFITTICPGYVETSMTDQAKKEGVHLIGLVSSKDAIRRITSGLRENEATIVFPTILAYPMWLLSILPPLARDLLAKSRFLGPVAYFGKRGEGKRAEGKKRE